MRRVFLSYNHDRDHALVTLLRQRLQESSQFLVIEPAGTNFGHDQTSQVTSQIQRASLVIVLFSSENNNVLLETGMAIGAGKSILIVGRESESLPAELRMFPFLYSSGETESDVSSILERVRSIRVEEEHPRSTYHAVDDKLSTYHSDPAFFESLSPMEFEDLLIDWFRERGYEAERPTEPSVYGIDVIARSPADGSVLVIEAKKLSRHSRVSLKDVMALLAAAMLMKAQKAVLITSSSFTAAALQMASELHGPRLCLWTMDDLLLAGDPAELLK